MAEKEEGGKGNGEMETPALHEKTSLVQLGLNFKLSLKGGGAYILWVHSIVCTRIWGRCDVSLDSSIIHLSVD
jgi:hypothetical protein